MTPQFVLIKAILLVSINKNNQEIHKRLNFFYFNKIWNEKRIWKKNNVFINERLHFKNIIVVFEFGVNLRCFLAYAMADWCRSCSRSFAQLPRCWSHEHFEHVVGCNDLEEKIWVFKGNFKKWEMERESERMRVWKVGKNQKVGELKI